ncbi:16375_t:CDS:10 [Acaulospora colombiana]|uniref:16375_t:CDS:1 n=1 Tax=Acaulospora colombiana TaxID=27376 RepID=A0ACA9LW08_9GLOM|nr:16375_t:CDS:10 [Acaulospora colombiana]
MSEIQSATMEYGPEIFANNFWVSAFLIVELGKDEVGYEVLIERLKQAKRTCEEIKAMYHERALIEEEYAKRLSKLSKIPLGKDETGILREALEVARLELEENAKDHMNLSHKMKLELEQELSNFMIKQKEKRKSQQSIAERSLRNKQGQAALMQKAKEKYEAECIKIAALLSSKATVVGKELEKLNLKIEKAQISAKAAGKDFYLNCYLINYISLIWHACKDQEYMQMVKTLADATEMWNYDWRLSCDKFQDLEEERIDYLKISLWNYTNLVSTVCVADDESCERIRVSLENCNPERDILIFIQERGTGPEIPEPPAYVNFYADSKENGSRFKRAAFDKYSTHENRVEEVESEHSQSMTPSQQLPENNGIKYPQSKHALYNYLPEDNISHYSSKMSERASLYANMSPSSTIKPLPPDITDDEIMDESIDPNRPQMLSVGSNVLEVQTSVERNIYGSTKNDENIIEKAIADMSKLDEVIEKKEISVQETVTPSPLNDIVREKVEQTPKVAQYLNDNLVKPEPYHLDKPQPVIPSEQNPQQQNPQQRNPPINLNPDQSTESKSNPLQQIPVHQQNIQPTEPKSAPTSQANSPSPVTFPHRLVHHRSSTSNYSSYQKLSGTPSVVSSTQSLKPLPVEGPGDLRCRPSTDYGPVSSQQQQIQENLAALVIYEDLRATLVNSLHSLSKFLPNLNITLRSFLNDRGQSSFIQVNEEVLLQTFTKFNKAYVANDGRLPPINPIQQQPGRQAYNSYAPLQSNPANHHPGLIRPVVNFGRPPAAGSYMSSPTNIISQSSFRDMSSPKIPRNNTVGSNDTFDLQNRRSTFSGPIGLQQFPQHKLRPDYPNPNLYATTRAEYHSRTMPARYAQITNEQKIQRTDDGRPIRFYVRALFDYLAQQPDEIPMTAGDIIAVLSTDPDGWWEGEVLDEKRKKRGIFPSNYTEVLKDWIS